MANGGCGGDSALSACLSKLSRLSLESLGLNECPLDVPFCAAGCGSIYVSIFDITCVNTTHLHISFLPVYC